MTNAIDVQATEMNRVQFKYTCSCKKGYHWHGNGGDWASNRVEKRGGHCSRARDVRIHITDQTRRTLS